MWRKGVGPGLGEAVVREGVGSTGGGRKQKTSEKREGCTCYLMSFW